MVSEQRWLEAQRYEASFWRGAAEHIQRGDSEGLGWYTWKASRLSHVLERAFADDMPDIARLSVLEVGSGPVGIVSYLTARERTAVDPLCAYYETQPGLVDRRDPGVTYLTSKGESLPVESERVDLVIIDNVIDHVLDAGAVMSELERVLRPGGTLYLTVNLHPAFGALLHRLVSAARIDRGHPHTFTIEKIRAFLKETGFDIAYDEWEDYRACRRSDLRSSSLKDRLKGFAGLSEFLYTSVSVKRRKTRTADS